MKVNLTISIEDYLKEKAKALGLNISQAVETIIREVLSTEYLSSDQVRLKVIELAIQRVSKEIDTLDLMLKIKREKLKDLSEMYKRKKAEWEIQEKSSQIAGLMREINDIIFSNGFDVEKSWKEAEPYLIRLKELEFDMTRERFEQHVKDLKAIEGLY